MVEGDVKLIFDRNNSITGSVGVGLFDNFDKLKQPSNSILPHVRTEIIQYLKGTRDQNVIRLQYDNIHKHFKSLYSEFLQVFLRKCLEEWVVKFYTDHLNLILV